MTQIKNKTQTDKIGFVLMGNKCDSEERIISNDDGNNLGTELGIKYFETSVLHGKNIQEAFTYLTEEITKKKKLNVNIGGVGLNTQTKSKKKGGCYGGDKNENSS